MIINLTSKFLKLMNQDLYQNFKSKILSLNVLVYLVNVVETRDETTFISNWVKNWANFARPITTLKPISN